VNESRLVIHGLHQKVRLLTKEVNERLKKYELFSSQWSILFCIMQYGPTTQSRISQYLNVEAPTITRTINRLEKYGWVVRESGEDLREKIVILTNKGRDKIPEIEREIQQFEDEMTNKMSLNEKKVFLELLKKIGE
jgi:MarR family transcriptional regulator, transcriptional regulator for hemolysin